MKTQLLCTFTSQEKLSETLQLVRETYNIVYNYIYVLQNKGDVEELFVSYNINSEEAPKTLLDDTVIIHRKKETNTLYSINALNGMVKEQNGGKLDKKFALDWNKYKSSIILTNPAGLKHIKTRIYKVIDFTKN